MHQVAGCRLVPDPFWYKPETLESDQPRDSETPKHRVGSSGVCRIAGTAVLCPLVKLHLVPQCLQPGALQHGFRISQALRSAVYDLPTYSQAPRRRSDMFSQNHKHQATSLSQSYAFHLPMTYMLRVHNLHIILKPKQRT